jgi:hypothetical protein
MASDIDKLKTMSNEQELLGRLNEVLKERFILGAMDLTSSNVVISNYSYWKPVAQVQPTRVMLLWTPPRFDKKTALRSKGLKVQHRERTKPDIWWHNVLGALASLDVWTNDSRVDMAIIMELKYLNPHNSFVRLIKVIDQTL